MDFTQAFSSFNQPSADDSVISESNGIFDKLIHWGLIAIVFIIPLFFLPWTFEVFELNKQFLLLVLTILLFVFWVAKGVFNKGTLFKKTLFNWLVLAWLIVVALATVFSVDQITSVFGFYGRFNGGLISVVAYVLLFFLLINNIKGAQGVQKLAGWWLTSLGIATFLLILQLFGIKAFSFIIEQPANFYLLGNSLNSVVLLLAAGIPIGLWLAKAGKNVVSRIGSLIFVILAGLAMLLIDYQLGWLALVVGLVVWLVLIFIKNEQVGFKWTMLPSLLLLLAVIAWPLSIPALTQVQTPVEINLSANASWKIAMQNVKANPVLGTGPETFIFGFSKYKPESFNDSNFWAFRFDKAGSDFAQVLSTTGFLGFLVYLAIFIFTLGFIWKILKDKNSADWYLKAAVSASFLVVLISQIFYFTNTVSAVSFWLILALLLVLSEPKEKTISLTSSPRAAFIFSFGLALVVLVALGVFYGVGRFWMADVAYAKARVEARDINTLNQATLHLQEAVNLNPWRDIYHISFAQVLLAQANIVANSQPADTEQGKQQQLNNLRNYVALSINQARLATDLGPENVANWEALGSIYRGTVLFAKDSENWVIDSFSQAIKREPSNPALYTELGKAYLLSASRKMQEAKQNGAQKDQLETEANDQITLALAQFDQAIKLKDTYTPAHFNQVLAYELQGKINEAIGKLERMREFNPNDVDVLFELGNLYFTQQANDKALEAFKSIISLVPSHANALYATALVYEAMGDYDNAIGQLEIALKTNPDNKTILDKIDAIKTAKSAKNSAEGSAETTETQP
ncbi:MAG: tetratricopeptide repeat protein [Patescibacteria group bacterium]